MQTLTCKLSSLDSITDTVYRVRLLVDREINFRAGQYLMVVMDKFDKRPFSVASKPTELSFIELHIGSSKKNLYSMDVIERIIRDKKITIEIPYGKAWLRCNTNRPIILIAGGIGYSYIRSILLTALTQQHKKNITIYWGGKQKKNLYLLKELKILTKYHPQLSVVPVVEKPDKQWKARSGTVITAIMQDYYSLRPYDIYIAGPFEMAIIARKLFHTKRNAVIKRIFSDAFTFIK